VSRLSRFASQVGVVMALCVSSSSCLQNICWLCCSVVGVLEPARITVAPRSVKVLDNSVLSLVCHARGNPEAHISWSRGGRRIQPANTKRYTIVDIGKQQRTIAIDDPVAWASVTRRADCAKTAERIDVLFGVVLDGVSYPHSEREGV